MLALRFVFSRLIKLFGNASKGPAYAFHCFFPRKRFRIPAEAKPLMRTRRQHRIPRILWQTNFTDRVTLPVYVNYLFNRLMSPTFAYRFMNTEARANFIRENFSDEIFHSYSRLQIGAAQADLWRILALRKYGGAYMDIDAHAVWPLGFVIGDNEELYIYGRDKRWTNYFFASVPDNPHLDLAVAKILSNIASPEGKKVVYLTGPKVFEEILQPMNLPATSYRNVCIQGTFTNEYFQYIDHPQGKYTAVQSKIRIVKEDDRSTPLS